MNLLTSVFLFAIIACSLIFNGCLKSNCTDQVKNSELFGIWYYYRIKTFDSYCDSTNSIGSQSYSCRYFLRFDRSQIQFAADRFIEEKRGDTTFRIKDITPIDSEILKFNISYLYAWDYSFRSTVVKDWFVDNNTLVVCENNSLCFESECNVYTWKIENEKLFLQNDQTSYVLTREDLFEKIRNSVQADTSEE